MITVRCAGLGNYKRIKNLLGSFNPSLCEFYSEFYGPYIVYVLRKECWLIMDNSSLLGIIFKSPVKHQIYYIPTSQKHLSFMSTAFLIKKYTKATGYTLKLTYSSASFKAASAYLKVRLIKNLKHMQCNVASACPPDFIPPQGVEVQSIKKGEESIRVELQNSIFGGNKNRTPLTIDEVINEEGLKGYIGSMCYILRINDNPIGYGQIMVDNGAYSLVNFGIIPSSRGYGYGDIFLKCILYQCKNAYINNLQLTVDNNNPAAIGLYKKNGFIELYNTADLIM